MAAKKPKTMTDEHAIVTRRKLVAELYAKGHYQFEIAALLKVSSMTISYDLQAVRDEWRSQAGRDVQDRIDEELAKLDLQEREAWQAWERSKQNAVTTTTVTSKRRAKKGGKLVNAGSMTTHQERGQAGDPRFLERIEYCRDKRLKLLGLLSGEQQPQVVVIPWDQLLTPPQTIIPTTCVESVEHDPIEERIAQIEAKVPKANEVPKSTIGGSND